MPYNLRKRTRTEPPPVIKKRKSTAKPELKSETKSKAKSEPKPKSELKLEPKSEPKLESKLETKLEQQSDSKDVIRKQLVFGADTCGELGLGKIGVTKKVPTCVLADQSIKHVICGPMHTISLSEDGQVYSYGCNDEGALGRITDGDETLEATPTLVPLDGKVIKVTAGDSHSAVLIEDGRVFVWGNFRDEHGSVGLTPSCEGKPTYQPISVLKEIKFKDIASGSNHMLLLDVDGNVYSFGVGAQGQLGRLPEEETGDKHITVENRELFLSPQKVNLENVDPNRPFVCDAIYAGNFSSFATNSDKKKNRLAGWGLNNYFQLGYKNTKDALVQRFPRRATFTCSTSMINVACGQHHTLFLTRTGRVYSAGRHQYGMLGLGKVDKEVCPAKRIDSLESAIVDISAGINTSFAVANDGKLYSWGMSGPNLGSQEEEDLIVPKEVKNLDGKKVVAVSTGSSFTSLIIE